MTKMYWTRWHALYSKIVSFKINIPIFDLTTRKTKIKKRYQKTKDWKQNKKMKTENWTMKNEIQNIKN